MAATREAVEAVILECFDEDWEPDSQAVAYEIVQRLAAQGEYGDLERDGRYDDGLMEIDFTEAQGWARLLLGERGES